MANVTYSKNSPYFQTQLHGKYLDVATIPSIPKLADDVLFSVNKTYEYRPDLLAFDLYGDYGLWWVFAVRNPNTMRDPVFDLKVGNKIYLPKKDTLNSLIA